MIGQATKEDLNEVMPLLLSAIGDIAYTLAGTDDDSEVDRILGDFFVREDNRISYKHVLVDRRENEVAGMLISYGGDDAAALDVPFAKRPGREIGSRAGEIIAVEAEAGEYYLDSIAVNERFQGQGIAKALISAFEQKGKEVGYSKLSLIVEPENTRAHAIYKKLGFIENGTMLVSGSHYIRMVKEI